MHLHVVVTLSHRLTPCRAIPSLLADLTYHSQAAYLLVMSTERGATFSALANKRTDTTHPYLRTQSCGLAAMRFPDLNVERGTMKQSYKETRPDHSYQPGSPCDPFPVWSMCPRQNHGWVVCFAPERTVHE